MLFIDNEISIKREDVSNNELNRWDHVYQNEFFRNIRGEIAWRLPILYFLFAVLLGFIISYQQVIGPVHRLSILAGILGILFLQFSLSKVKTKGKLFDTLYLICGIATVMPLGFLIYWQYNYFFLLLTFSVQALCWMVFPWPLLKSISWSIFLLSYWSIILSFNSFGLQYFPPLFFIAAAALSISRFRFQELSLFQSNLFLTKLCASTQNSFSLCLQLCRLILNTLDTERGLVMLPDGALYAVTPDSYRSLEHPTLTAKSLYTHLKDKKASAGYLRVGKSELTFKAFFHDCLQSSSHQVRYFFVQTIESGQQKEALFLIPARRLLGSITLPKINFGIGSLIEIYNISLFTLRNQTMSNDTVLAYGTALADREADINHLVHSVNNKAQEIAINCDSIRHKLSLPHSAEELKAISAETIEIENNLRMMTQNVSDIKLIREMLTLRSMLKQETVSLQPIISEFHDQVQKVVVAKNLKLEFRSNIESELDGVIVPSAEYFETVLRAIFRTTVSRLGKGSLLQISVLKNEAELSVDFLDNGNKPSEDVNIKAAASFARIAGGSLQLKDCLQLPYKNLLRITLKSAPVMKLKPASSGNWVLLVDDNEQVMTFYSRIAEALGMQFKTAGSFEQAVEILRTEGRPRLVITDIQLANSSGLDLVQHVRELYDQNLPVIVVSGNDDADVSSKAYKAGASKYLKKPLGRKKLFSEIEGLL